MNTQAIAETCTQASWDGSLNFPQILEKLAVAGIEGYYNDLRSAKRTHYLPNSDNIEIAGHPARTPIAETFDAKRVEAAVRQSQRNEHTYPEFCEKIAAAGCAAYIVSLLGRRAIYLGRTGETYVEPFPGAK
jgi:uncharacterized protein YbcV (DUF1398 family)